MSQKTITFKTFDDEVEKCAATVRIVDRANQAVFFYYEEMYPELIDEEGNVDEATLQECFDMSWSITTAAMGAAGLRVIGIDEATGRLVATFEPVDSVKEFLISDDIGHEESFYMSDVLEDTEPDSGFGFHHDRIMSE